MVRRHGYSATGHSKRTFWQSIPFELNLRSCLVDLGKVRGVQFNRRRSYIFLKPIKLSRSRNRHDPRSLYKQPGKRNLGRSSALLRGNVAKQID
jgi:hypothetical protein